MYVWPKVSIVIATHNMKEYLMETVWSCAEQKYPGQMEIVVYDDASTDGTDKMGLDLIVRYFRGDTNLGVGDAFNCGIFHATGEIIVLMCADDLWTNKFALMDTVAPFLYWSGCGVVTRWYHQFVDADPERKPCRAWRTMDPCIQANNPSGLAFRRESIEGLQLSNKMMIESAYLVKAVTLKLWGFAMIRYDTVKARVHQSTSQTPGYWLKRRVSSPVKDWWDLGVKTMVEDYVSLIQIKCGYRMDAVWEEIRHFVTLNYFALLNPIFYFWVAVAILTPRSILRKLPHLYRWHIGRRITKEVVRPYANTNHSGVRQ